MKKLTIFLPLRLFPAALPLRMRKPAPIRIRAHHHVAGIRSPFQQKAHAGTEAIPLARDGLSSRHRFSWKARSRSWALEARKKSGGGRVPLAVGVAAASASPFDELHARGRPVHGPSKVSQPTVPPYLACLGRIAPAANYPLPYFSPN